MRLVLLGNEVVPSKNVFGDIFDNAVDLIIFFMAIDAGFLHSKIAEAQVQNLERQEIMQAFIQYEATTLHVQNSAKLINGY